MVRQEFDPVGGLLRALPHIVVMALVSALALGLLYDQRDKKYTSETRVTFDVGAAPAVVAGKGNTLSGSDAERALATQADVVTSDEVLGRLQKAMRFSAVSLRRNTTVTLEPGSNILTIAATASTPTRARDLARGLADAYADANRRGGALSLQAQADALQPAVTQVTAQLNAVRGDSAAATASRGSLLNQLGTVTQQQQQLQAAATAYAGQVDVLAAAALPTSPSSPGRYQGAAQGLALGALLGSLNALLLELRRSRNGPTSPAAAETASVRTPVAAP